MESQENIRNFGIVAHIDAGKTTTTERVLFATGTNYYTGEVDEGTTTTDWMVEERERGISIVSAGVTGRWKECLFHLIDTPGHVDFTAEVQRSLRVLDGAVVVFCGVSGVQTQTETVWRQAQRFRVPVIGYINKLDRASADYQEVVLEIEEKLDIKPAVLNFPVYRDDRLYGLASVLDEVVYLYNDHALISGSELPDMVTLDYIEQHRTHLIDTLSSYDDLVAEAYLKGDIDNSILVASLRRLTIERKILPLFCGSSLKNIGIEELLDGVVKYLPSPADLYEIPAYSIEDESHYMLRIDELQEPLFYVFKIQHDNERGRLAYTRIYSGTCTPSTQYVNTRTGERERIHDILKLFGNSYERMESAQRGDIVILSGLKNSVTGDSLCGFNHRFALEPVVFPEPVIHIKVEPDTPADSERFLRIKEHLEYEDPTIRIYENRETGDTLISGMGELHLEVLLERMSREYKVKLKTGKPSVAYRERPTAAEGLVYTHSKPGEPASGDDLLLELSIAPKEQTGKHDIVVKHIHENRQLAEKIEKAVRSSLLAGPLSASVVIDADIVIDFKNYDDKKHKDQYVESAVSAGMFYLLKKTPMVMLEPYMTLSVTVPTTNTGTVIGDLQSRSAEVVDIEQRGNEDCITAKAPLRNSFGYLTDLRNITHGKGSFSMEFAYFGEVKK